MKSREIILIQQASFQRTHHICLYVVLRIEHGLHACQKVLFVLSGCLNVQSDMEEIEPRFKRLKIDPEKPPFKRKRYRKKTKRNQIDSAKKLISWEDLKKLTTQASRIIRLLGKNRTPVLMVATVIALLGCQVKGNQTDIYWTYFPDPPLVHPAVWTGESIPVFINDSFMMGGFTDTHITPNHVTRFNFSGYSAPLSLCWSHDKHAGCLKLSF
uniref:spindle and kinetochore-associated protein 2 isoform X2 n=1 Tax=Ictidomys tridecemlineatus TaxID=43179 RepID=UPI001A9DAFF8|nr:spindle and kinetochore-associated protein 2 isoform X2 [Ictidomys tridecemlineatus]XP_040124995.1 spindle and kinetochore-associated protein 2 isoform X2 [Ictidomys tridecemlineatus]